MCEAMFTKKTVRAWLLQMIALLLLSAPAQAQSQLLLPATLQSRVIGAESNAETLYIDSASASSVYINLSNIIGGPLAMQLVDVSGISLAQSVPVDGGLSIIDAVLPSGGRYFVFVHAAPGSGAPISYDILFDFEPLGAVPIHTTTAPSTDAPPAIAPSPTVAEILLSAGLQVQLSWQGTADLNLEVRDPSGQALHWNARATNNGGGFGFDANGLCEVLSDTPTETATWQPGFLPTGSYEIIVYYEQACDAVTGTVPFTIEVTADGQSSGSLNDTLAPGAGDLANIYVTRFVLLDDGSAVLGAGGAYPSSSFTRLPRSYNFAADAPQPIQRDVAIAGEISNQQPFRSYSFDGAANELVSIDMRATSKNLDTLVQLIDPEGRVVDVNDDAFGSETTDSAISSARLLTSGIYTILATRYAKDIGGTEGQFELILSSGGDSAAVLGSDLNLPAGDVEVGLYWATKADLQLLVRDPLGESVFDDNPISASGGILQEAGNVNCSPSARDAPLSYIYWPPGFLRAGTYEIEVWYQAGCADFPEPVSFTLQVAVAGTNITRTRQFPLPDQRYVTNFTVQPSGVATAGEGGYIDGGSNTLAYQDAALAAPILERGAVAVGTISPDNVFDVYQFAGTAGETVTIRMSAQTLALDTNLYLVGPSGQEIASNDDANPIDLGLTGRVTDSQISNFTLPENGPYTIIATRYANQYGGTIGVYELSLSSP